MNLNQTITLAHAPAVPGLRFRSFAGDADYAKIADIDIDSFITDGLPFGTDEAEVRNEWMHLNRFDPDKDLLFAELDGETVAYGRVNWRLDDTGKQTWSPYALSKASARRKGIGTAMMHWLMQRITARIATEPAHAGPRDIIVWNFESELGRIEIYKQFGFAPFRYGFMMKRPLTDPIADLALPVGVHLRGMTRDDLPKLHEALNEAFRDHFGHAEPSESDRTAWLNDPHHHVELYMVAVDDATGEIAGGVLNRIYHDDIARLGVQRAWTDPIFVRRAWRRTGLAKALIARSLALFKAFGYAEGYLGVDALNPNGALKLYEGLGYVVDQRSFRWQKKI